MKKFGLIGVGKMGLSHLAIVNMLPNVEIVAICDTSKVLLSVLSRGINAKTFTDYTEMLNNCELDAVIVSVPNSFHYQVVTTCLNKGVNTFIEKPLTLAPSSSKKLLELADKNELILQAGYVNRFCDSFMFVQNLLDKKIFGNIINYISTMNGPVITKPHNQGWRNDYEKGGGCLNDYGPHCIDLVCYLFGGDFNVNSAELTSVHSTCVDDIVKASLTHKDGAKGELLINWSDNTVRKATNKIKITLDNATILVSKQEIHITSKIDIPDLNITIGENIKFITDFETNVDYYLRGEEFSRQLSHFYKAVDGSPSKVTNIKSAYKVDKTISDIFKLCGVSNG
jgi:predicted dehydrogenase